MNVSSTVGAGGVGSIVPVGAGDFVGFGEGFGVAVEFGFRCR